MNFPQSIARGAWLIPAAIVLGFAVYVVYPGGFSPDSQGLYAQATGFEELTNAKPVVPILLMRVGVRLFGDGGFVIINCLVYFLGAALMAGALFGGLLARSIALLLLVTFPPLLLINLTNWIDAAENAALAGSIGCLLWYLFRQRSPWLLFGSLLFSLWAMLSRYNAASTVFFLQAFAVILLAQAYCPAARRKLVAVVLGAAVFGFSLLVSASIGNAFGAKDKFESGHLYVTDLVGLSLLKNENLIPRPLLREAYRSKSDEEILAELQSRYTPSHNWNLWKVVTLDEENQYSEYAYRTLLKHPASLLYMRYETNKAWLTQPISAFTLKTYRPRKPHPYAELEIASNRGRWGLAALSAGADRLLYGTPLFTAGWYLLWLSVALVCAVRYRQVNPSPRRFDDEARCIMALALCGIFTWLPLIPITNSAEFRYLMPAVLCSIASFLVLARAVSVTALARWERRGEAAPAFPVGSVVGGMSEAQLSGGLAEGQGLSRSCNAL